MGDRGKRSESREDRKVSKDGRGKSREERGVKLDRAEE